jgi:hypothetical protein
MRNFYDPPKCRACGHTICPTAWACLNPKCPKNMAKKKVPRKVRKARAALVSTRV